MKSKIIITAVVLAILGSFAFITIDKTKIEKSEEIKEAKVQPLQGIVKEDSSF